MDSQGVVCVVHDKSRRGPVWFLDIFFLQIINLHFLIFASFGVISGKHSGFLENAVRQFFIVGFYDDVGTRHSFCMEPPVISGCKLESEFIVLVIIFPNINIIAVGGAVVERLAL